VFVASLLKTSTPRQFLLLAGFLVLVFLTGGASRHDVVSLLVLKPASVLLCAAALLTLRRSHLHNVRNIALFALAGLILAVAHLIPLPPMLWQALPGRQQIAAIDDLAGLGEIWRPLTLTPMMGWFGLTTFFTPLAVFLLGIQLDRPALHRLLYVLIALGMISALLGIAQSVAGPASALYLYRITNNDSAVGLFANRNHSALMLAMLAPMLATFVSIARGPTGVVELRKIIGLAGAVVLLPLILVTGSRAGVVFFAIGIVAAALLYRRPEPASAPRRGERILTLRSPLVLGGGLLLVLTLSTIIFSRATSLERLVTETPAEESRFAYWQVASKLAQDYAPVGSGIGSFAEVYQIAEPEALLNLTYLNRAHNDWLEIYMTFGWPGAVLLVIALAGFLLLAFKAWRVPASKSRQDAFPKLATVLLFMIALASVPDYPLRTPIMMSVAVICLFWLHSANWSDVPFQDAPPIAEPMLATRHSRRKAKQSLIVRLGGKRKVLRGTMIMVLGLVVASATFALTLTAVARSTAPQIALAIAPWEGTAIAAQTDMQLVAKQRLTPATLESRAQAALRNQPLNPRALRQLAIAAELRGQKQRAAEFITASASQSRRDLLTQLWLIEKSADRGDINGIIRHYDMALRTSPAAAAILYPRLAKAIRNVEVRRALRPYIDRRTPWTTDFFSFAREFDYRGVSADGVSALVDLMIETRGPHDRDVRQQLQQRLFDLLFDLRKFDDLTRLYLSNRDADQGRLTNISLTDQDLGQRWGPIGWQMLEEAEAGASFAADPGTKQLRLVVFANPATIRPVARKLLFLKPGVYQLSGNSVVTQASVGSSLVFQLRCLEQEVGQPLARTEVGSGAFVRPMTVPATCKVQVLEILASGGQGQSGMETIISNLALKTL
jgi:O-antigen ligase